MSQQPSAPRRRHANIIQGLARQLSVNAWNRDSVLNQLQAKTKSKLTHEVTESLLGRFPDRRPGRHELVRFLRADEAFRRLLRRSRAIGSQQLCALAPVMQPQRGRPESWRLPAILTPDQMASWLGSSQPELVWLTKRPQASHKHYMRRWSPKRSGGWRLVEAPRRRLKQLQRQVLDGILNRIPPHDAAHGFCLGRSIQSFVSPHIHSPFALRMDLQDFFPSVVEHRVEAIFRTAGYPSTVSELLGRLVTVVSPTDSLDECPQQRNENRVDASPLRFEHFRRPHLPQGAPTSPALANLAAYRLDCRLRGLAQRHNAQYTRYADDLLFSGADAFQRNIDRFHVFALSIILEEGFRINPRKTRKMARGARQIAAGLVFNQKANTPRDDYDRLRATLYNCYRHGIASQNREEHPRFQAQLLGRIQFHAQTNPRRGAKLMALYQKAFPSHPNLS